MKATIDNVNRGDKIKIISLDDSLFNIDYKNKEGIVERIDYFKECLYGSWGKIEVYPEFDDIEILVHHEWGPIG